jgi:hypothetical protein
VNRLDVREQGIVAHAASVRLVLGGAELMGNAPVDSGADATPHKTRKGCDFLD